MKTLMYRGFKVSAKHCDKEIWQITVKGFDQYEIPRCKYNVERDIPKKKPWYKERRWWAAHYRTFDEALTNTLQYLDQHLMRLAKADQHELLMEARLTLAEELLP